MRYLYNDLPCIKTRLLTGLLVNVSLHQNKCKSFNSMDFADLCRVCLSTSPSKNISDLKSQNQTCSQIMSFCLNIQLEMEFEVRAKLCVECFDKIVSFHSFKLLAMKTDTYFKKFGKSHLKEIPSHEFGFKKEHISPCDSDNNSIIDNHEIKLEPFYMNDKESDYQSDDEALSVLQKIKYELIPVDTKCKENVPHKASKGNKNVKKVIKAKVCEECGKSVKDLREHVKRHKRHRDKSQRLPCPLCDKTFASYDSRSKHKQRVHLGHKQRCSICNKNVLQLKQHIRIVHNPSSLPYECGDCGKRFRCGSVRDRHATVHSSDKPYKCDFCSKTFRLQCNMIDHQATVHQQKEKTLLCEFCSKSFNRKKSLVLHLRTHTNERPHKCEECGKAFSNPTILKNHMYTHCDDKAFGCTVCGKRFTCPRYLTNHMLCHTRVKRYPCNYCDMKFHRSDHRKQHEVAIHKTHQIATPPDIYFAPENKQLSL